MSLAGYEKKGIAGSTPERVVVYYNYNLQRMWYLILSFETSVCVTSVKRQNRAVE